MRTEGIASKGKCLNREERRRHIDANRRPLENRHSAKAGMPKAGNAQMEWISIIMGTTGRGVSIFTGMTRRFLNFTDIVVADLLRCDLGG
jgi:hypothetical protein